LLILLFFQVIDHLGILIIFSTLPLINYLLEIPMFIIVINLEKPCGKKFRYALIYQDKTPQKPNGKI
jgi:hypothetical protein